MKRDITGHMEIRETVGTENLASYSCNMPSLFEIYKSGNLWTRSVEFLKHVITIWQPLRYRLQYLPEALATKVNPLRPIIYV